MKVILIIQSPLLSNSSPPLPSQENYNTPVHLFETLVIEIEQLVARKNIQI